jgi:sec-independent protein translocase protein TatA
MSTCFPTIAFIEGIGGPELMMIMFVVLLLFGGKKLPELAKGLGKSVREFKKAARGVEEEFKRALEETPDPKTKLPAKTHTDPKPAPADGQEPTST